MHHFPARRTSIWIPSSALLLLALFGVACSGSKPRSAKTTKAAIPADKCEVLDGWLRLKQVTRGPDKTLGAMEGESQYLITGNPDSFMVDKPDFRWNAAADYQEVRIGAILVPSQPPHTVGPPAFDPAIGSARSAPACGGGPTQCIAGWYGCGPLACEDGRIIGACAGGWGADSAP
jgi:hypothetical protein